VPTSSVKRAWIVVAILLLLIVCVLGIFYYRQRGPLPALPGVTNNPGPPPDILTQLPLDAPVVAYVDASTLRKLQNSPLASVLGLTSPGPEADREYQQFVADTGFDYTRDLDHAAIAFWPASLGAEDSLSENRVVAIAEGRFDRALIPVFRDDGTLALDREEFPRPQTTMEGLAKLKAAFGKAGTVTAGNASGIVDGAAAVVLMSLEEARKRSIEPLGRIVSWGVAGVEPKLMGRGPVPATKVALQKAGLSLDYIDLIEVNEAFAAQYLAVEKELGLDREKVNVNGGAIALGHPLGATGTRLVITLLYELRRRKKKYGLATACIGGGQGIAMIVESMN